MDFFGVGPLEALLVVVVALLVLGPRQLPRMANRIGTWIYQARASVAEVRDTMVADLDLDEAVRSAEKRPTQPPEDPRIRA